MKATEDLTRISEQGKRLGKINFRLFRAGERVLKEQGKKPKERCATCAFRLGTVPNGCLQTQADAAKAIQERVPFFCHHTPKRVCRGWYAACQAPVTLPPCPWKFSEPDKPNEEG